MRAFWPPTSLQGPNEPHVQCTPSLIQDYPVATCSSRLVRKNPNILPPVVLRAPQPKWSLCLAFLRLCHLWEERSWEQHCDCPGVQGDPDSAGASSAWRCGRMPEQCAPRRTDKVWRPKFRGCTCIIAGFLELG